MRTIYLIVFLILPIHYLFAQAIVLNGTALNPPTTPGSPTSCNDDFEFRNLGVPTPTIAGNCITMTNGTLANGATALWVCTPLDLTLDFNITFDANFGTNVASGDGIVFVMDGDPDVEIGGDGGNLGYHTINPSVSVEFDTWPDADISCDHAEMHQGGIVNNISNPVPLKNCCGTVKDGLDHSICISWDVSTSTLTALFDGNLVAQYQGNVSALLGSNSPIWGITTGCGAGGQVQRVCNVNMSNTAATVASCTPCTPPVITVPSNPINLCTGNPLNVPFTSSSIPVTYCWSAADNPNVTGETLTDQTTSSINDVLSLTSGTSQTVTYTVYAESNGCMSAPLTIDVIVSTGLNLIITDPDTVCSPSTVDLTSSTVTAGSDPGTLSYWTDASITIPITDPTSISSSGTYYVVLSNGSCSDTGLVNVEIIQSTLTQNLSVTSNYNGSDISCYGASDASIQSTVSGGQLPYNYVWSTGQTSATLSSLAAGNYTVTVTDQFNCVQVDSIVVNSPDSLDLILQSISSVCSGGVDGSIDISASGGTGNFVYSWSNGSTSEDQSGLTAGNYFVTITDFNGCNDTFGPFVITQSSAVVLSDSIVPISCFGDQNGSIFITVDSGITPLSFNWSDGSTTQDLTGLDVGTFSVTVTDSTGCSASISNLNISQPSLLLAQLDSVVQNECSGQNNGSITLAVSGSVGPYDYLWSNGATSISINSLYSGSYSVTVTDSIGCTASINSILIDSFIPLTSNVLSANNISCYGLNDGQIDVDVFGGVGNYSYLWSNGATTQDLNNIDSGTYTLVVTDSNNCTAQVGPITIIEPDSLVALDSIVNVPCFGQQNGAVFLQVSGGSLPYSFNWSSGANTQNVQGLFAGVYNVSVTDDSGCSVIISSISVTQPSLLLVQTDTIAQSACAGQGIGYVGLGVSGSVSPYSFIWSTGDTTSFIDSLYSGIYDVTVTDANGCTASAKSLFIDSIPPIIPVIDSFQSSTCNGSNDAFIASSISGGTGSLSSFTFNWNNGDTTLIIDSLIPGAYTLSILDSLNCPSTLGPITITEPDQLIVTLDTVQDNVCFGDLLGSIDITIQGGTQPYIFGWNSGQTIEDLSGLPNGGYSVTVTDDNFCVDSLVGIVVQSPDSILLSVDSIQNVSCFGASDGAIFTSSSGGIYPYSFDWNTSSIDSNLVNINGGIYTITLTDANACTEIIDSIVLFEPDSLILSIDTIIGGLCFEDSIIQVNTSVSGGTSNYIYIWSDGSTDSALIVNNFGVYAVTVIDANNCTDDITNIDIVQPAQLTLLIDTIVDVSCSGNSDGLISITSTGGTGTLQFNWSSGDLTPLSDSLSGGFYAVTVTDSVGCIISADSIFVDEQSSLTVTQDSLLNILCFGDSTGQVSVNITGGLPVYQYQWSNGSTSSSISNVPAGVYTLTVTDADFCTNDSFQVLLTEPNQLVVSIDTLSDIRCFGDQNGFISIQTQGGTLPYSLNWSTGDTTTFLDSLNQGTYAVSVIDANGCEDSILSITINEPLLLQLNVDSIAMNDCFGDQQGYISVINTGGTQPVTYAWSNGDSSSILDSLSGGFYTVTVTDSLGCQTLIDSIQIDEPQLLQINLDSLSNVLCFGDSSGSLAVSTSGGTSPISYLWSTGATTSFVQSLSASTYSLTVTDAQGCNIDTIQFLIDEPAQLQLSSDSISNILCNGDSSGLIMTSITGGVGPYSYNWSNGQTDSTLSNLGPGTYQLTVTDVNACIWQSLPYTITEPSSINISIDSFDNVQCNGDANGTIFISVSGGVPSYSYTWNTGQTIQDLTGLSGGTYQLVLLDSNACSDSISLNLFEPDSLIIQLDTLINESCDGQNDGLIQVQGLGGNSPLSYVWSNGGTSTQIFTLSAGLYQLTITDSLSCVSIDSFQIDDTPTIQIDASVIDSVSCNGLSDGSIDLTVSGGASGFSYIWSSGQTSSSIGSLTAGFYSVTITDSIGCFIVDSSIVVDEPDSLLANAGISNIDCFGDDNGEINVSVIGGTIPYIYQWSAGLNATALQTGLEPGSYQVTISDYNNCQWVFDTLIITEPDSFYLSIQSGNVRCFGEQNGSSSVQVFGGTPNQNTYDYSWSSGQQIDSLFGLGPDTYTITVTDSLGCQLIGQSIVLEPDSIVTFIDPIVPLEGCFGEPFGVLSASAIGGNGSFNFVWSTGASSQQINNLQAASYTVTITDSLGCTSIDTSVIGIPVIPTVDVGINIPGILLDTVNYGQTTTILTQPDQSNSGVDYIWTEINGQTNVTFSNPLAALTNVTCEPIASTLFQFEVLAISQDGCQDTGYVDIFVIVNELLGIPNAFSPNGDGLNDLFRPANLDPQFIDVFQIFNRFGQLVYDGNQNNNEGWNGRLNGVGQPVEGYVYLIEYTMPGQETKKVRGEIVLIR